MRAYSMDFRDRAFRLLDAGLLPDAQLSAPTFCSFAREFSSPTARAIRRPRRRPTRDVTRVPLPLSLARLPQRATIPHTP